MSYVRGASYVWQDGVRLHVWIADGYDGWDESVWADAQCGSSSSGPEGTAPSGVCLPLELADELAVMRVAELLRGGRLAATVDRALAKHAGNGGCDALRQSGDVLRAIEGSQRD